MLRRLEMKDAPFMLEWMHDIDVVKNMKSNFLQMTLEDCENFIRESNINVQNIHLAIADSEDQYMGTVSLKNIEIERKRAEFAITIRKCAMGRGFAKNGMQEILLMAFEKLNLDYVYWYVKKDNIRARKFYEKMEFTKMDEEKIRYLDIPRIEVEDIDRVEWYIATHKS